MMSDGGCRECGFACPTVSSFAFSRRCRDSMLSILISLIIHVRGKADFFNFDSCSDFRRACRGEEPGVGFSGEQHAPLVAAGGWPRPARRYGKFFWIDSGRRRIWAQRRVP